MKQTALNDMMRILDRAQGIDGHEAEDGDDFFDRLERRYGIPRSTARRWPSGRVPRSAADRIIAEQTRAEYVDNVRTGKIDPQQRPLLDGLLEP